MRLKGSFQFQSQPIDGQAAFDGNNVQHNHHHQHHHLHHSKTPYSYLGLNMKDFQGSSIGASASKTNHYGQSLHCPYHMRKRKNTNLHLINSWHPQMKKNKSIEPHHLFHCLCVEGGRLKKKEDCASAALFISPDYICSKIKAVILIVIL